MIQTFFWRKVKNIIRQNKKSALQEFLFGSQDSIAAIEPEKDFEAKIENLQQQVDSLQEKVMNLEIQLNNSKYALRGTLDTPVETKIIQQGDSILKTNMGSYFQENDGEVIDSIYPTKEVESKSVSEVSKSPLKTAERSEEYNLSSKQEKSLNETNFVTLGNISEQERIEIIKTGFQRQAEGKISLKKYYESTQEYSVFQFKGYQIKYETIRRTKLYQNLKD